MQVLPPRPRRDFAPLDLELPRFLEEVHELRAYVNARVELRHEERGWAVAAARRREPGVVNTRFAAR